MFRADLEAAGIPYVNESGLYADFHCLRHTTGSFLAASGANPKVAQEIMRHSDINLTMSRYSHVYKGQTSAAIENLPDLSKPSAQSQKAIATGTNGAENDPNNLALCLALKCGKQTISEDFDGQLRGITGEVEMEEKPHFEAENGVFSLKMTMPKEGIEPSPCCQDGILNPARLPVPPLRQS